MFRSSLRYRMQRTRTGKHLKNHISLLIILGVALLTIILTVIWGNIWGKQAQESAERREEARLEAALIAEHTPEWLPAQPAPLRAHCPGSPTSLSDTLSGITLLAESGTTAVSLPLYRGGVAYYDSATAQAFGRQTVGATDLTLPRLRDGLPEGTYLSATVSCDWQLQSDAALRRILRSYEAAIAMEIAHGGADEVLLLDLILTDETLTEALLFLRDLRTDMPDAVIGVAVPTALMLSDERVEIVHALLTWADFLALDLRDTASHTLTQTDENGEVIRTTATVTQMLDLLRDPIKSYRMRLLLSSDMQEEVTAMVNENYENWQIVLP